MVRRKIASSCEDSANQGGKMQNHNIPCWRWRMKKPRRTNLHWEERPADTEHWIGSWPSLCLLEPTIPSGKHPPCRGDLDEWPSFFRTQQKRAGTSCRQWKMLLHLADGVGDRDRVRPWRGRAQLGQEGHGRRRHLPRHLQVHLNGHMPLEETFSTVGECSQAKSRRRRGWRSSPASTMATSPPMMVITSPMRRAGRLIRLPG